jgi:hypothetical protein
MTEDGLMTDGERADALMKLVNQLMRRLVTVERSLALKGINLSQLLAEAQAHELGSAAIAGDQGLRNVHQLSPQEQRNSKGTGWQKDTGFPDRSRDFELMDAIVERHVGGPNSPVK